MRRTLFTIRNNQFLATVTPAASQRGYVGLSVCIQHARTVHSYSQTSRSNSRGVETESAAEEQEDDRG